MKPGSPPKANWGRPQSIARSNRADARDTRAGKSPGEALVHPCPRQYVIQGMLRRHGSFRAGDPRSNPASPPASQADPAPQTGPVPQTDSRRKGPPRRSILFPGSVRRDPASRSATETRLESSPPLAHSASVGSCGQFQNPSNTRNTRCQAFPADYQAPKFSLIVGFPCKNSTNLHFSRCVANCNRKRFASGKVLVGKALRPTLVIRPVPNYDGS